MYNMNKIRNIEIVSADILNDDFIVIFQPIFFLLRILGFSRVNIKYRYPSEPSTWYHIYSNFFWILNTCCLVYFFTYCGNGFTSEYANSTLKFGVLVNGINGVLILCRNNLQRSNKICQMYVKLQKIERRLNMKNIKNVNKNIGQYSWFIVLGGCFLAFVWIVLFNTVFMRSPCPPLVMLISTGIGLLAEIAEVYFIIHLVISRVNYLNDILRQEVSEVNNPKKRANDGNLYFLMNSYESDNTSLSNEVVNATFCILDALSDFTELFQFSGQSLTTKLEESRKLCIDIVSLCLNDCKSREYAKQIILLVEGRRSLSIYNIFTLGTRLPLHLLAVTASYTIVLLQFALL
ncbi:hypothetical protein SFRURICE_010265 [Spodoptera frugiperda]|nr:hypothetical protein SFRURICE_010265 [Spodoptera frugiperda]